MVEVKAGQCALSTCAEPLPKYRRRWCSDDHRNWYSENHHWGMARHTAVWRDERKCIKCGSTDRLEVNHIIPRMGRGYGTGCQHHQTNLETLCHNCHVKITNEQRKDIRNRQERKYWKKWSVFCQCSHPYGKHSPLIDREDKYWGCRVEGCSCRLFVNAEVAKAR